jgi:hypothetical protein
MNLDAEELDELEGLSDADLAALIRAALAKFRGGKRNAEDDVETGTPSKGGPSAATLETVASQRANTSAANDSAQRLREQGLSERRIREILHPSSASAADRAGAAKLIPGLDRLP